MNLYFIVIYMNLIIQAHGHSNKSCNLEVVNKFEFESEILGYLDINSDTMIIEYDLDFSHVGSDFDLANRTNPNAIHPWRWYRTKGIASKRILYNQFSLFRVLLRMMNKKFKVYLTANPPGCLDNIGQDEIEANIRNLLLNDFEIPVKELRTSVTFSTDVAICTAHDIGTNYSIEPAF
uniref:Uncharacterized protein n=1 Tax=Biomphalaria glabrata TaxID=6526 RepID=A0A2C9M1P2_BIOGL